jgi:hypothetical protein
VPILEQPAAVLTIVLLEKKTKLFCDLKKKKKKPSFKVYYSTTTNTYPSQIVQ